MNFSDSVKNQFSMKIRNRGRFYYDGYLCDLVDMTDETAIFEVQGSNADPYCVVITYGPRGIDSYECDCPYFVGKGNCKHIWGSLLELDGIIEKESSPAEAYRKFSLKQEKSRQEELKTTKSKSPAPSVKLPGEKHGSKSRGIRTPKKTKWASQLTPLTKGLSGIPSIDSIALTMKVEHAYVLDLQNSLSTGSIFIELLIRERLISGAFGKWKNLLVSTGFLGQDPYDQAGKNRIDELTRDLILANESAPDGNYYSSYWSQAIRHVSLKSPSAVPLLRRLCESGNFQWALSAEMPVEDRHPIEWDEGPAWEIRFVVESHPQDKEWVMTGELFRPGKKENVIPLDRPALIRPGVVLLHDNRLARCESGKYEEWIEVLRSQSKIFIPFEDRVQFLKVLHESGVVSDEQNLRLPTDLKISESLCAPIPKLIGRRGEDFQKTPQILGKIHFDYQGMEIACDDPRQALASDTGDSVITRDLETENEQLRKLFEIPGIQRHQRSYAYSSQRDSNSTPHIQFAESQLPRIVEQLNAGGWACELDGKSIRKSGNLNLEISSGIDWFDLEVTADFEGAEARLPELLAATRSGSKFVKLSDGTYGTIASEWLEQLKRLAGMAEFTAGKLRYSQAQALLMDAMLATREDVVRVDRKFGLLRKKLREFDGIKPAEKPGTFRGELREYQKFGLGWLKFLHEFGFGGCLADDMGLGKTIQVLAFLESRRKRRKTPGESLKTSLIVVPKSLIFNWMDEASKFCPNLKMAAYHGKDRKDILNRLGELDVLLTTYGTLRLDVGRLQKVRFDYAILDEAQAIKNPQSLANKAVRLIDSEHRLALTGTPIENHLGELWALFEFLNPGLLGRSENFRELTKSYRVDAENLSILSAGIRPYLLRRTKQQVLTELPEKTEQTLFCELSPKERKQYDELKAYYRIKLLEHVARNGIAKSQIYILEALLRLRQTACHPGLVKKTLQKTPSAKLETLLEQLQEVLAEGHKVLVFSQFTTLLGIVKEQLDKLGIRYEYLDGKTTKRKDSIERFQTTDDCPVFLLSLKAGGVGLNLTAADYVFILDPWWNPAVEKQAVDRAHRIGQTNRVFAYRLIARDTVEEKILDLQQQKKELADSIITADSSLMQSLTVEDLQLLLS